MVGWALVAEADLELSGTPKIYASSEHGRRHFCADCGTKLWLSFERFPGKLGLYAGTFDDPCWFAIPPETSKHIFLNEARRDVEQGLRVTLDYFVTREQQEQALSILQFKLDILWTLLDAMTMAYVHKTPPYHNCEQPL